MTLDNSIHPARHPPGQRRHLDWHCFRNHVLIGKIDRNLNFKCAEHFVGASSPYILLDVHYKPIQYENCILLMWCHRRVKKTQRISSEGLETQSCESAQDLYSCFLFKILQVSCHFLIILQDAMEFCKNHSMKFNVISTYTWQVDYGFDWNLRSTFPLKQEVGLKLNVICFQSISIFNLWLAFICFEK